MIDIRKEEKGPTQIRWCENTNYNIFRNSGGGMTFNCAPTITTLDSAELFIKAVQKAIDLGWVK